jgi:hypothetical protein
LHQPRLPVLQPLLVVLSPAYLLLAAWPLEVVPSKAFRRAAPKTQFKTSAELWRNIPSS